MTQFWAKTTVDGKPGISVYEHMLNVGCVARLIAEQSPEIIKQYQLKPSIIGGLAALHDLGKISPGFQRKCVAWLEENSLTEIARNYVWDTTMESDHGKVSHTAIQQFLLKIGINRDTAKFVSTVIGAHHGHLTQPNDRGYFPNKAISETTSKIDWDIERLTDAHKIWEYFADSNDSFSLSDDSPALWWLAGLTSVADWIGSDERFFSPERRTININASELARKALDEIGFTPLVLRKNLTFESMFGFSPNDMQVKALTTISRPGVYVIEAPMGMGKTEAALGAAYQLMVSGKANGIYFALPTQMTSNRIYLRMNEFLKRIAPLTPSSRLIHGNSWLMRSDCEIQPVSTVKQEKAIEDARTGWDWFNSSKRALIAPFGVGTIDQALLGVVAAKHFFIRHFALAGKVVILDEVHSYDLYTGTLIDTLITTLRGLGCTVIILSATLTGKRRRQLISQNDNGSGDAMLPYPLISGDGEDVPIKSVASSPSLSRTVHVAFINIEKAMTDAIALATKGGAVLWICDTVDAAQKQVRQLKEYVRGKFPVGLLHSRFPFWRREVLENEWMSRFGKDGTSRCGSILVSTQVVEQSVDLDADLLITELAPTDMLLQRLGRLWRHERGYRPIDKAQLYIVEESCGLDDFRVLPAKEIKKELGNKALVYAPYVLLRSLEVWKDHNKLIIPSQIRSLIESTYEARENEPESWQQLSDEWFGTDSAKKMMAYRNGNIWQVALEDKEGVQTRLNEMPTISMVLCRSITRDKAMFVDSTSVNFGGDTFQLPIAQAIHKNLVKIPKYCFDSIKPCSAFADYLFGEQTVGRVEESGTVAVEGLKNGVQLFYSDELGLVIEKTSKGEKI